MFDFEKLKVYQDALVFNEEIKIILKECRLSRIQKDQLERASLSIPLNIAEGSGRFTKPDRKNFYIIARSSVFECAAILEILSREEVLEQSRYSSLKTQAEEISKMLFGMVKSLG
ncbi:four helix bundle protein [bacterium]|nr:four helix bundle protein [bacterium]